MPNGAVFKLLKAIFVGTAVFSMSNAPADVPLFPTRPGLLSFTSEQFKVIWLKWMSLHAGNLVLSMSSSSCWWSASGSWRAVFWSGEATALLARWKSDLARFCTCNLYLAMFSSACNLKIMIARRNFDELVQQWPVNDDEVEMIRRHLLQLVTENGQT